jgi:plastocyanin
MKRGKIMCGVVLMLLAGGWLSAAVGAEGEVKGKIAFKGDADKFKRSVLDTSKDPNCAKSLPRIGSEDIVLNTKTTPVTVRNVLVYVKDGLGDKKFEPKKEPVTLDQHGCQYKPHVLGLMEGQELIIKNSDDTNHNIHFLPKVNDEFNKTQPKKDMTDTIKLKAEAPFHVKCDVHPWMGSYIGVFKHPFFAVTGEEGTFEMKGLPPGKYTIAAWHEKWGEQVASVEVGAGESKEIDFTFEPK